MRNLRLALLGLAWFGGTVGAPAGAPVNEPPPARPAEFWRGIVAAKFAVPAGGDADALAWELTTLLADPDPERRDGFGFEITAAWLQRGAISPAMRARLAERWRAALARTGADDAAVLERSFAALNLSVLIAVENKQPSLEPAAVRAVFDAALAAVAGETETRGYDARLGWVHPAAHQADLLKFLARSPHLGAADLARLLAAIEARAAASAAPWIWGEDERYAAAVLSVARRAECDRVALAAWVKRLNAWPGGFDGVRLDVPAYHRAQNAARLLRVLHVSLAAGAGPDDPALAVLVLGALRG